jgi:NAD(P)-dependent dehydrogenase (short-subunit alcohol dehydrogenase family)
MDEAKHRVSFDSTLSPRLRRGSQSTSTDLSKLVLPYTTDPPSSSNPPKPKVWLVFGATGHMGRSITKAALSHNDMVAAVGQSHQDPPSSMEGWHEDKHRYLGLLCDVRIRSSVAAVIQKTIRAFGRIDIIANCSGYGVVGACEDQDEHEIRNQFETNFMGTLNIIQLSLPHFRQRQNGRYLIFSSTSGALGVPGLGPYCATKYAVEGLIESMLYEVAPFNIDLTLVEPGHMRRDDIAIFPPHHQGSDDTTMATSNGQAPQLGEAIAQAQQQGQIPPNLPLFGHFKVARPSSPYSTRDSPAAHTQRTLQWMGSNQPTSVVKAAELVWQIGHCRYPPLRLLLGSFAIESIRDRLKSIIEEIEDWKHLSFPPLEGFEEKDDDDEGEEPEDGLKEGTEEALDDAEDDQDGEPTDDRQKAKNKEEDPHIKMENEMDMDD